MWVVPRPEPEKAAGLARAAGISELVARLLLNRGITAADRARSFLRPRLSDLADPSATPGLDRAAARIRDAIRAGERLIVCGDYDVDGITGTALLITLLRTAGSSPEAYLPDRLSEGYGLSEESVRRMADRGPGLLVTVDHGTTAGREIALARELGLSVVVVDHHLPGGELPDADAIVNPWLGEPGEAHPCGVGVAYKLAWGVFRTLAGGPRVPEAHRDFLLRALDLVALGTVADVVPLRGENRILTRFGLPVLADRSRPGIRALLETARIDGEPTATDIAFRLAPRINAAGRLGRAELALELLLTDSPDRAREIALRLERANARRRKIEDAILEEARARVRRDYEPGHRGGLVLGDPAWHPGVIGIVAARLVRETWRPVALAAFDGDLGRGSCRTIPAVHLGEVLQRCSDLLVSHGGHAAAAGFTIRKERFETFRSRFDEVVRGMLREEHLRRVLRIDAQIPLSGITPAVVEEIERMAPFGEGNPRPVVASRGIRVAGSPRRLGRDGAHLSFLATDGRVSIRAIAFGRGPLAPVLSKADLRLDIAYTPGLDRWRGDGSLELSVKDIVPLGTD